MNYNYGYDNNQSGYSQQGYYQPQQGYSQPQGYDQQQPGYGQPQPGYYQQPNNGGYVQPQQDYYPPSNNSGYPSDPYVQNTVVGPPTESRRQQTQKNSTKAKDFHLDEFTEEMSVHDLVERFSGGNVDPAALSKVKVLEDTSRDLPGFDMDEMRSLGQRSLNSDGDVDLDRGLFGFGGGHGESKKTHQLIGGAAAWAAVNWYQNKSRNEGKKVNHGFIKKLVVAFAAAQAIKYWEKNSGSFQQGVSRDRAIEEATRNASMAVDKMDTSYVPETYVYETKEGGEASTFDKPNSNPSQQGRSQGYPQDQPANYSTNYGQQSGGFNEYNQGYNQGYNQSYNQNNQGYNQGYSQPGSGFNNNYSQF